MIFIPNKTIFLIVCGHTFHQHCVDPWLLNHRHCPLCNLDILAAYRISIPGVDNRRLVGESDYHIPISLTSLATTAAMPIAEQQQQTMVDTQVPTISGSLKDDTNGEHNPSFRSDDQH
jgi:hypothetical protein